VHPAQQGVELNPQTRCVGVFEFFGIQPAQPNADVLNQPFRPR
jgi:hypothetical protein